MSDMGTGEVRGSSAPGNDAIMNAHSEATALTGKQFFMTVE